MAHTEKQVLATYIQAHLNYFFNPLTPGSDYHLISPYNVSPESHSKVRRIK